MGYSDQHPRILPTYTASLNSDFNGSDTHDSAPEYSRSASPNERVLAGNVMRAFSSLSTQDLQPSFEYSTDHLTLNLGDRKWHCPIPAYGYAGTIEGMIKIHQIETVSKVEVVLLGEVLTTVSEEAVPSQGASKRFFKQKSMIWSFSSAGSTRQETHAFVIAFPKEPADGGQNLPPSFYMATDRYSARIQYRLRVDLFRKGLRRHKSLEIGVAYLPKSYAPVPQIRPMYIETKSSDKQWWTRHLLPPVQPPGRSNTTKAVVPWEIVAELFLPSQMELTATSIVPYTMRIQLVSPAASRTSHTPASLALVEASVQLVKSIITSVHGLNKRTDTIIAQGTILSDYQGTNAEEGDPSSSSGALEGVRVINGNLEVNRRSGSELSWECQGFVQVKYCLMALVKPPPNVRALEGVFPTFRTTIDVDMKTHTKTEEHVNSDEVNADPSVGLFNLGP